MASDNELLLDVEVDPWGGSTISIEDLDTDDRPGVPPDGFKTEIWCWSTIHSIDVYTMSQDESETTERLVRVRVYRGTDSVGLGERAFDGELELTTGTLAVGAYLAHLPKSSNCTSAPASYICRFSRRKPSRRCITTSLSQASTRSPGPPTSTCSYCQRDRRAGHHHSRSSRAEMSDVLRAAPCLVCREARQGSARRSSAA